MKRNENIKNELIDQALREHEQIRQLIAQCSIAPTEALLTQYMELLTAHIRYEERVLFPYMEQNLSDETLAEIGRNLSAEHHTEVEEYPGLFGNDLLKNRIISKKIVTFAPLKISL